MKIVEIDFNSIREDGLFRVSNYAANGALNVGEAVLCLDPDEEDLRYIGYVDREDGEGFFILEVDWQSNRESNRVRVTELIYLQHLTSFSNLVRETSTSATSFSASEVYVRGARVSERVAVAS